MDVANTSGVGGAGRIDGPQNVGKIKPPASQDPAGSTDKTITPPAAVKFSCLARLSGMAIGCNPTPRYPREMCPLVSNCSSTRFTVETGTANPAMRESPLVAIPITLPCVLMTGPPEEPGYRVTSRRMY